MLLVHISDIHFKATEVGQPDDPNRALRSDLVEDVKKMRTEIGRPANGIILTGDIAFAGKAVEYDFAYKWLEEELCPAAGCTIEEVFVIPGNHDVDRTAEAGPAQQAARAQLRQTSAHKADKEISKWLRDRKSSDVIFGPIENYNRFAAKFVCMLRPYLADDEKEGKKEEDLPGRPFARRDLVLNDGSELRLWGFNSVLVSGEDDAKDNMLIDPAASQIEPEEGVTHLVTTHHPFNWLKNGGPFEDRVNKVAKIQLFGHEHTRRVDEVKRYLRIRAGALQPDRDERDWKPGYNWIGVLVDGENANRKLVVQLWVRMHEVSKFIAIPDDDDNDVWTNKFDLPNWSPPTRPVDPAVSGAERNVPEDAAMEALEPMMSTDKPPPVTWRSVTIKLFKLKEPEQRRVIASLKLNRAGDRDLKDYEAATVAVRRSRDEGSLEKLDTAIDEALAERGRS
jgi:predicted phosphodiesterase